MKINKNYVLQEIADEYLVVPVGEAATTLHGVIRLSASGAFLWKMMEQEDSDENHLVNELCKQFAVDNSRASIDVRTYLETLQRFGCLEIN